MKQKIIYLMFFLMLTACGDRSSMLSRLQFDRPPVLTDNAEMPAEIQQTTAVMLLPLSGHHQAVGEALRNAGMLAQFERSDNQMELVFFDTKGTPEGAKEAYDAAMSLKPDVILGPVFSAEVKEISSFWNRTPIISFTSDVQVLSDGVYSLALSIPNQVQRMVDYACTAGQRRLAVLGPENKTSELAMNALSAAIKTCPDMVLNHVSLYPPETVNFEPPLLKFIPKPIDPKKENLTSDEEDLLKTPLAERLDFDALFIFEDGVKLTQISSLLVYFDVTPQVVPIYGLSVWQRVRDRNLSGAYFPGLPTNRHHEFDRNYQKNFGKKPIDLAGYGYDAVALASFLSTQQAVNKPTLTNTAGYNGVNGRFRFNADGTNDRLLNMYQLKNRRPILIDFAPADFKVEAVEPTSDFASSDASDPVQN